MLQIGATPARFTALAAGIVDATDTLVSHYGAGEDHGIQYAFRS